MVQPVRRSIPLTAGDEPSRVRRACEYAPEFAPTETVMAAMTRHAAGLLLTFDHHHVADTEAHEFRGGREARGTTTDDTLMAAS